jgi:hypothetical protein
LLSIRKVGAKIGSIELEAALFELNKKFRYCKVRNKVYCLIQGSNLMFEIGSAKVSHVNAPFTLSKKDLIDYLARAQ